MLHVNICGLMTNFNNFLVFLQSLEKDFDLMVVSETHVFSNLDQFKIKGYDIFYNESKLNWCDGTIIYARSNLVLNSEIIKINESNFLRVSLIKNSLSIGVIAHYRLPSTSQESYLINVNELLQKPLKNHSLEIFVGDTNLDILNTKSANINRYINTLASYGYKNVINGVTRENGDSASCIDHIALKVSNQKNIIKNTNGFILKSSLSDHYPVLLNVHIQNKDQKKNVEKLRFKKKINKELFSNNIKNEDWEGVLQCDDPNEVAQSIINKMQSQLNNATSRTKIKSKLRGIKPWITKGLVTSIRQRDKLKKLVATYPNNITYLNNYREYRNNLSKLISREKNSYYSRSVAENMGNPRKVWQTIGEVTGQDRTKCSITCIRNDEGQDVYDNKMIARDFNKFFSSVGKRLGEKIAVPEVKLLDSKIYQKSLYFRPVTDSEIINHINSLKNGSAGGDDEISVDIVKENSNCLAKPLTHLVNCVLGAGVFPSIFKSSVVIPVYKSNEKNLMNNYRPIALTSTISKILEKCIKVRLLHFLESNNILSKNQYGFRENRSTEDAIAVVTNFIISNFNKGNKPLAVFLDLSKAFDTVEHHTLLKKMENFGIRGSALNIFRTYLNERTQIVKVNDSKSEMNKVECGVPQGTVLGPILFTIYVNSLAEMATEGQIVCFADDTVLLVSDQTWQETFDRAERAMMKVKHWLDSNLLTLNNDKTYFVGFAMNARGLSTKESMKLHKYNCDLNDNCNCTQEIKRKETIKYLGVVFDQCMTWRGHIEYLNNKVRNSLYKFYELRNLVNANILRSFYKAVVESVLSYGITAWGAAYDSVLSPLYVTQKYVIKVMLFKNKLYPSTLLFEESKLLNLRQLYIKSIVSFNFRNSNYGIIINQHGIETRAVTNKNLSIPNTLFTATQRHISYTLPKVINILPGNLKPQNGILYKKIKNKIDNWIITNWNTVCYEMPFCGMV